LIDIQKQNDNFINWTKSKPTFRVGATYLHDDSKIYNGKQIGRPYCPFTIWTDPTFVERISNMSEDELEEDILGLLWD
jgi:hypothetical protein